MMKTFCVGPASAIAIISRYIAGVCNASETVMPVSDGGGARGSSPDGRAGSSGGASPSG